MRNSFRFVFLLLMCLCCGGNESSAQSADPNPIRLNSLGFLPSAPKEATVLGDFDDFSVLNARTGKTVFKGKASASRYQKDVDQHVRIIDFSKLKKPGRYYVEIPGLGRSADFSVGEEVYADAFAASFKAFYLWRCGTDVSLNYQGEVFRHDACHLDDGFEDYLGHNGMRHDGTKGWHDAGDYGKYVVNAGITVGILFKTWEYFQKNIEEVSLDLPETAKGYPEFLKELKWEIDWLFSMQYPDGTGRVSHKLTRTEFSGFVMPEEDHEKRFYTVWSSAATADFVGMMAQAARFFKPYDATYAEKCLAAARLSYEYLKAHPEDVGFRQGDFKTGGYQTKDPDDRLWAAVEMWETTGETQYLTDFENRARDLKAHIDVNWDWGNIANMAFFTYALSKRKGKDAVLEKTVKENIIGVADQIVQNGQNDVYKRPLGTVYYWGCNGGVARQTVHLHAAYKLTGNRKYADTALDAVAHLFGRNYYHRSFVTGLGVSPAMNPHHRPSGADKLTNPWPGYLIGGGTNAVNWIDETGNYERNEVAINWQAPLVFALAWFCDE